MPKLTVHAGDFLKGETAVGEWSMLLKTPAHRWVGEEVYLSELESVEPASEESVKRLGGTVGWGAAGAVLFGPVGLIAGLVLGGNGKDVTFIASFRDGRKMLATTDAKTFTTKFQAAVFV